MKCLGDPGLLKLARGEFGRLADLFIGRRQVIVENDIARMGEGRRRLLERLVQRGSGTIYGLLDPGVASSMAAESRGPTRSRDSWIMGLTRATVSESSWAAQFRLSWIFGDAVSMPFSIRGTAHFTAVSTFGAAQSNACSAPVATLSPKSRAIRSDFTVNPFDRFVSFVLAYDLRLAYSHYLTGI